MFTRGEPEWILGEALDLNKSEAEKNRIQKIVERR